MAVDESEKRSLLDDAAVMGKIVKNTILRYLEKGFVKDWGDVYDYLMILKGKEEDEKLLGNLGESQLEIFENADTPFINYENIDEILASCGFYSDETIAEIENLARKVGFESSLFQDLGERNLILSQKIDSALPFAAIKELSSEDLKALLERVDRQELSKALANSPQDLTDTVANALGGREGAIFKEDIEYMGPVRKVESLMAQFEISPKIREVLIKNLDEAEEVALKTKIAALEEKMISCLESYLNGKYLEKMGDLYVYLKKVCQNVDEECEDLNESLTEKQKESIYSAACDLECATNETVNLLYSMDNESVTWEILMERFAGNSSVYQEIRQEISEKNPAVVEFLDQEVMMFSDLLDITDRDFQKLLRELAENWCVVALKNADDKIADKVYKNMSKGQGQKLANEVEKCSATESEINKARDKVCLLLNKLIVDGQIVMAEGRFSE